MLPPKYAIVNRYGKLFTILSQIRREGHQRNQKAFRSIIMSKTLCKIEKSSARFHAVSLLPLLF